VDGALLLGVSLLRLQTSLGHENNGKKLRDVTYTSEDTEMRQCNE
jgi:hypothetical protein